VAAGSKEILLNDNLDAPLWARATIVIGMTILAAFALYAIFNAALVS
jgi:hypothetical protein